MRVRLGRSFDWLWSAYAVSTYGTWLAFGAFPLIAVQVLHASALAVSVLEAAGLAVAAVVAFSLGPWVEHRAKRPVMIAMDLIRFIAVASIPIAYILGLLSYGQLLVVSVISGTASIAFSAASGAYLKYLLRGDHLLVANGRFEGTSWVATAAGPPSVVRSSGCSARSSRSWQTPSATCCPRSGSSASAEATSRRLATGPPDCVEPTFSAGGGSSSATTC